MQSPRFYGFFSKDVHGLSLQKADLFLKIARKLHHHAKDETALEFYHQFLNLLIALESKYPTYPPAYRLEALGELGNIYASRNQRDKANFYYRSFLDLHKCLGQEKKDKYITKISLKANYQLGYYDEVIKIYEQKITKKSIDNCHDLADVFEPLVYSHLKLNQVDAPTTFSEKLIKLAKGPFELKRCLSTLEQFISSYAENTPQNWEQLIQLHELKIHFLDKKWLRFEPPLDRSPLVANSRLEIAEIYARLSMWERSYYAYQAAYQCSHFCDDMIRLRLYAGWLHNPKKINERDFPFIGITSDWLKDLRKSLSAFITAPKETVHPASSIKKMKYILSMFSGIAEIYAKNYNLSAARYYYQKTLKGYDRLKSLEETRLATDNYHIIEQKITAVEEQLAMVKAHCITQVEEEKSIHSSMFLLALTVLSFQEKDMASAFDYLKTILAFFPTLETKPAIWVTPPETSFLLSAVYDMEGDLHLSTEAYEQAIDAYQKSLHSSYGLSFWGKSAIKEKLSLVEKIKLQGEGKNAAAPDLALKPFRKIIGNPAFYAQSNMCDITKEILKPSRHNPS